MSLLITELSFPTAELLHDHAKVAILVASVLAAAVASVVLTARNRRDRQIALADAVDADADGIPDVYQR